MKKLMMALGAVAVATSLSAASVQWSIDAKAFKMSDGETLPQGQTVYLLDTSTKAYSDFATALASGEGYENLGQLMASTLFTDALVDQTTTYTASSVGSQLHKKNYAKVDLDANEDNTVKVEGASTYAIFSADGEEYLLSSAANGTSFTASPDDGNPASFSADSFSTGWQTFTPSTPGPTPAPEPTSGLLMLVGLAGLALRRKQK